MVNKLGNTASFGSDPRRVETAGNQQFGALQEALTATIQARYDSLKMSYEKPNNSTIIGGDVAKDSTVDSQEKESLIFFFHPDHLGSTSYVTGVDGTVAQHVEYIPYGEVFVEERSGTVGTAYLFNSKELDDETGMYYYGARYLDPASAMWISVDPMWEKFAGMTAYNYCAGNPVKMVDPDGRALKFNGSSESQTAYVEMLHSSTGKNYAISDGNLTCLGADQNFKGKRSQTLANTIQSAIDATTVYTIDLVGDKGDDMNVFIDSYENMQIDVADLKTIGEASTAFQGAAIGHFLNEIQAEGDFAKAHKESLGVEGAIYGELVGKSSITTRRDWATKGAINGYQKVLYEYDSSNVFELQQGATSKSLTTYEFNGVKTPFPVSYTETVASGELKSVRKRP